MLGLTRLCFGGVTFSVRRGSGWCRVRTQFRGMGCSIEHYCRIEHSGKVRQGIAAVPSTPVKFGKIFTEQEPPLDSDTYPTEHAFAELEAREGHPFSEYPA